MPPRAVPFLTEPVQGALVDEGVAVCVAVLLRTDRGRVVVAIPAEAGDPVGFVREGEVVTVAVSSEEYVEVQYGVVTVDAFSDRDQDLDEAAIRFVSEGAEVLDWPDVADLVAHVPLSLMRPALGVAGADPEPAGRGRARGPAGRGRGVPAGPPAGPGSGAGRGRATLATVTDQLERVVASLHGLHGDVQGLASRVGGLELMAPGRGGSDLLEGGATPDLVGLRAEVAARHAGGAGLGARLPGGPALGVPILGSEDVEVPSRVSLPPGLTRQPAAVPTAGGSGSGDAAEDLARAIRAQTAVLSRLRDTPASGDEDEEEDRELKLPGAKGAAAMDGLTRLKARRPTHFTRVVEASLLRLAAQHPGASTSPRASARAYVAFSVPFGTARTLGYLTWGLATAWDELQAGSTEAALSTLSLLLVGAEQAALDESSWGLAWLLTLLPEPPWTSMARRPDLQALRPYSKLASTQWVSAALSFTRDVERIKAARREIRAAEPGRGQGEAGSAPAAGRGRGGGKGGGGPKGSPAPVAA